ncbi:MAG: hypothetical protein Q9159_006629 [Coniocarpon cinnabarinum]
MSPPSRERTIDDIYGLYGRQRDRQEDHRPLYSAETPDNSSMGEEYDTDELLGLGQNEREQLENTHRSDVPALHTLAAPDKGFLSTGAVAACSPSQRADGKLPKIILPSIAATKNAHLSAVTSDKTEVQQMLRPNFIRPDKIGRPRRSM